MTSLPDSDTVAKQFCQYYYATFDQDRRKLSSIYRDASMMTYENDKAVGVNNIINLLGNLKFNKVQHKVTSIDAQPSGSGGILVYVTGDLKVDDCPNALKFGQMFQLIPNQNKTNFWVHNDIFKLNYG